MEIVLQRSREPLAWEANPHHGAPDLVALQIIGWVEHSAVNYTAEHHKPLFWRRLATKLSPLVVPQQCPTPLPHAWAHKPFPTTRFWILTSAMHMTDSLTTRQRHPWDRVANPHLCKRALGQSVEWT
jgi:hypothetical protein